MTQDTLKKYYTYCPETGLFKNKNTDRYAGSAGKASKYVYLWINKKAYSAHRMVFLYMYGCINNDLEVDHII